MPDVLNREWRDENDDCNYPFEDGCNLTSDSGLSISPRLFIDAVFYASNQLSIGRIQMTGSYALVFVVDQNGDDVGLGTIHFTDSGTNIPFYDASGREIGVAITDAFRAADFQSWPLGIYQFSVDAARFVAAVCFPAVQQRIRSINGVGGALWLVGGAGVILSCRDIVENGVTRPVVRVDAVGDPLAIRAICAPGSFKTPRFLQKIVVQRGARKHTILPNSRGDIQLTVGSELTDSTILRILTERTGLRFEAVGESLQNIQ